MFPVSALVLADLCAYGSLVHVVEVVLGRKSMLAMESRAVASSVSGNSERDRITIIFTPSHTSLSANRAMAARTMGGRANILGWHIDVNVLASATYTRNLREI